MRTAEILVRQVRSVVAVLVRAHIVIGERLVCEPLAVPATFLAKRLRSIGMAFLRIAVRAKDAFRFPDVPVEGFQAMPVRKALLTEIRPATLATPDTAVLRVIAAPVDFTSANSADAHARIIHLSSLPAV